MTATSARATGSGQYYLYLPVIRFWQRLRSLYLKSCYVRFGADATSRIL